MSAPKNREELIALIRDCAIDPELMLLKVEAHGVRLVPVDLHPLMGLAGSSVRAIGRGGGLDISGRPILMFESTEEDIYNAFLAASPFASKEAIE